MQIVFDFLAGKVPFDDFWDAYQKQPDIGIWLDQLTVFSEELPPHIEKDSMLRALYRTIARFHDGHVLRMLAKSSYPPVEPFVTPVSRRYGIFSIVEVAVIAAYPDVKRTRRYKQDYDYYDKAVGRSIGGHEVASYINSVLEQFPPTMKMASRVQAGKEALWNAFHIQDRKFPRWPQNAEWPMGKKSPMAYIEQKRDGDLVLLTFRDVDTGEIRVIEQFH